MYFQTRENNASLVWLKDIGNEIIMQRRGPQIVGDSTRCTINSIPPKLAELRITAQFLYEKLFRHTVHQEIFVTLYLLVML